ncbi:DUF294 nucleotidyltransferase-like domain-containing protein [Sutcliffiella horikoshii]|uniref:DUF294 nucleotidyltransferase-like domain-containing protein n=1 Tax=Sutcliffiella horikoshii TaxID=79883 RepID=UPI0020406A86|nr:DUF294 nucleotidyltransferase-like domain-containing protein [Sutcliffiella horikoshii]MCM3617948.1 DUF294 nucleotidyltransferase-like domain-containing protein [Sutcliffiella horikoshii]
MLHLLTKNLTEDEASKIKKQCETFHYNQDDIILHANENREGVFLVLSGMAEVYIPSQKSQGQEEVLEIIKPNELIGLSNIHHFLAVNFPLEKQSDPTTPLYPDQLQDPSAQYSQALMQVRSIDDTEALFIPYTVLKERWKEPAIRDFILDQVSSRLHDVYNSLAEQINMSNNMGPTIDPTTLRIQDFMQPSQTTIQAKITDTIQSVAENLSKKSTSTAAIITENELIKGIVTMHDFVNRVITTGKSTTDQVQTIMTENPITIQRTAYYHEALTTMLLNGFKHLPVTNEKKHLSGLVTLTDLLQAKQPTTMLQNLETLKTVTKEALPPIKNQLYATLDTMLQQQVPIIDTLEAINTLYDQLIQRCIELSIKEMPTSPPAKFCFYLMGSGARKEQFLLTDQDHFLVYEELPVDQDNQAKDSPHSGHIATRYFADLAEKIVANLELAGYKRCKGDMMASNKIWRGTLGEWESRIHEWSLKATNDRLLLAQNFFSYRHIYGDDTLHRQFQQIVTDSLDRAKIFLYRLSQLERENPIPTLEQPIRSMFRRNKKQVDLKKEVLFPYHHSLQILALMHGITYGTPIEKIDQLHEKKILSENFQKDLKASISTILNYYVRIRHNQHQNNEKLTSTLNLTTLTTREKEELMLSIRLIKELQSHMLSYY